MHLRVVTPRAEKVDLEVDSVILPASWGEICVLPGHTALISTLEVGVLQYTGRQAGKLAVNRGFLEVLDDKVTVLTETAESPDEVDVERARKALERAEARLAAQGNDPNLDIKRAEYALRRAIARINTAGK